MYGRENVLFISIGGNDIMNTYKLEYGNMGNAQLLLDLFDDYKRTLVDISKKTNMTIVLLDLYYPPGKTEYHKHITMWNELLKQFANDRAYSLLEVSEIMNKTPETEINKITKKIKIFIKVIIKGKSDKKENPEIDYTVPIEVSGMDTVENVKYKVQEQEGRITSRVIHLDLHKDEKKLKNNEMLTDHNIQENDTLILKKGENENKELTEDEIQQKIYEAKEQSERLKLLNS